VRPPGRWATSRNILTNDSEAIPCRHCDIPILFLPQDTGIGQWYHQNVPSSFWTLCPNDPEKALDGLVNSGQASTRPEPWVVSVSEAIEGLRLIEADLR
jgi:hypothetical protein